MKLSIKSVGVIVALVLIGGVLLAVSTGIWGGEGALGRGEGRGIGAGRGKMSGTNLIPDDIRGSSTLTEISSAFGIPVVDIAKAFGVDGIKGYEQLQSKDIRDKYQPFGLEIGNGSMKWFVALYKGLPHRLTEETFLPQPAVNMLKQRGALTPDQLKYIESHVVMVPPGIK